MKKVFSTITAMLALVVFTACGNGNGDGANDGSTNGDNIEGNGPGADQGTDNMDDTDNTGYDNMDTDTIDAGGDMNDPGRP
jgi:hypothetical protein